MDARLFAAFAGLLVGIIVLILLQKRRKTSKRVYDERQELIRGRGFRYGFCGMGGVLVLLSLLYGLYPSLPIQPGLASFIAFCVGIEVMCAYNIMNDAYYGIYDEGRKWIGLNLFLMACNLLSGGSRIYYDGFTENGKIAFSGNVNLVCGLMFAVIFIAQLCKQAKDKRKRSAGVPEEDVDEES